MARAIAKFQAMSENLHGVSERFFFWKAVEDLFDTIDVRANLNPDTLRDVMSLRMGRTVAGTIRSHVKDERLAQMLDHFTQYVGSNPYGSPAVLCAIAHMQAAEGIWYPMGGTRAVAEALAKLAGELGATLKPSTEITGLDMENGAVRGVKRADGGIEPFDCVVSNMDSIRTYRELVGGDVGARYDRKGFEPACSGVVLYLGLNRRYDHILHHDFVFSRDAHEEFDYIYNKGEPAPDPNRLSLRAEFHRPLRGARGRRGAVCARAYPLSAPTSRLVADVPGLSPGDPRQAQAHCRNGGYRGAHRGRAPPHAAGYPRSLQGAQTARSTGLPAMAASSALSSRAIARAM